MREPSDLATDRRRRYCRVEHTFATNVASTNALQDPSIPSSTAECASGIIDDDHPYRTSCPLRQLVRLRLDRNLANI